MGAGGCLCQLCVRKKVMVYQSINVSKCFSFSLRKYAYTKVSHGHGRLFGVSELVRFQPFLSKCFVRTSQSAIQIGVSDLCLGGFVRQQQQQRCTCCSRPQPIQSPCVSAGRQQQQEGGQHGDRDSP